tara:strand:- start:305 stop:1042 length:738 start_codon:yes stop_codon:yes gene_type:complete
MTRKQKRFIKNVNRSNRDPNTGYQDERSGQYYITDNDGNFLKFVSEEEARNQNKKQEVDEQAKMQILKEESLYDEKSRKKLEQMKKNPAFAMDTIDEAINEYFTKKAKLREEVAKVSLDSEEFITDEDIQEAAKKYPRIRNMARNSKKAMAKAFKLSETTDAVTRQEVINRVGASSESPTTPKDIIMSPELRAETSMKKESLMRKNMDVQPGSFSTKPSSKEQIMKRMPKKKYSDDELLRIISGK